MACEWGHDDCINEGKRCTSCIVPDANYQPPKKVVRKRIQKHADKADGRMGSSFEYANHKVMKQVFTDTKNDVVAHMTLNSGATIYEKGDEQIHGLLNIMEELKTQEPDRKGGTKQFTIQRKWLNKLKFEVDKENMDTHLLLFSFSEPEGEAGNAFAVYERDEILSLMLTVVNDRKRAKKAEKATEVLKKKLAVAEAEIQKAKAQLEYLQAKKELEALDAELSDKGGEDSEPGRDHLSAGQR